MNPSDKREEEGTSRVGGQPKKDTDASFTLAPEERGPLLVQMWTDLFRLLTTLGVAACAGLLILLELEVIGAGRAVWLPIAAFASGTLVAAQGQASTLELVERGGGSTKLLKRIAGGSVMLMGMGAGYLALNIGLP